MPAQPTRRRSEPNAGPPIVDERIAPVAAPVVPAPSPAVDDERPVKFTALLDAGTVDRLEQVTTDMRRVGRLAAGRYPSRADVVRALVGLVADDQALADRVAQRITVDLSARTQR